MKIKEEFESLVQSLTELELADLVDYRDEINECEEKINRLERELDETEDDLIQYKNLMKSVIIQYAPLKTAIEDFENTVARLTQL